MDVSHFNIKTYSGIEYALLGFDKAVVIVFTYCPPKYAIVANFSKFLPVVIDEACQLVNNHRPGYMKLILMGDLNFQPDNPIAAQLFQSTFGLKQLINSVTTDYGTCLDHIYTNMPSEQLKSFGTLESYYSDHKPLFITFTLKC